MERRDVLGLLAGAGGLGAAGCGGVGGLPNVGADTPDMDKVLGELDGMMKALQSVPVRSLEPKLVGRPEPERKKAETLIRSVLRSLVLVGTFRELPLDGQLHPGMQERMRLSLPELEATISGARDLLVSFTENDKKLLGAALKKDPDLVMNLLSEVDEEATKAGVPLSNRIAMRRVGQHVSTRIRQSAAMFLDESVERTDRMRERARAEGFDHQVFAAKATEEALWKRQQVLARAEFLSAGKGVAMNAIPAGVYGSIAPPMDEHERLRRVGKVGHQFLTAGWTFFGLSWALNGAGIAIMWVILEGGGSSAGINASIAGGVPLTHGVAFLILGIAMVVAGYNKIAAARAAGLEP
jgi:hypothetical protein